MTRKVSYVCDGCKRPIENDVYQREYLELSARSLPETSGVVIDVYVYPLLEESVCFCGLSCLKRWVQEKVPESPK